MIVRQRSIGRASKLVDRLMQLQQQPSNESHVLNRQMLVKSRLSVLFGSQINTVFRLWTVYPRISLGMLYIYVCVCVYTHTHTHTHTHTQNELYGHHREEAFLKSLIVAYLIEKFHGFSKIYNLSLHS